MSLDRRRFVLGSLAAVAACAHMPVMRSPKLKLLVLGGTGFLGPHVVTAALARGHTVTLFNRGKTRPDLFPEVEKLRGDRDGHLEALAGRSWDVVVDPSGFVPRLVKASAELLAPNVGRYIFISTITVYRDDDKPDADETSPVRTIADPTNEDTKTNYGALKALCEQAAEAAMPGRVANLRPGLIVGPGDPSGRFSHWVTRMKAGDQVLGPGDGATPVQWIDGRDLGAFIVHLAEQRTVGTMTAIGPAQRTTMKQVLDACNRAAGGKAEIVWVAGDFLAAHDVAGWAELPMWIDAKGEDAGFGTLSNTRALAAGLTLRPIAETAADTLAWLATLPADEPAKTFTSGIARDKERAVLTAWLASAG